jgi:hypothetical protein
VPEQWAVPLAYGQAKTPPTYLGENGNGSPFTSTISSRPKRVTKKHLATLALLGRGATSCVATQAPERKWRSRVKQTPCNDAADPDADPLYSRI